MPLIFQYSSSAKHFHSYGSNGELSRSRDSDRTGCINDNSNTRENYKSSNPALQVTQVFIYMALQRYYADDL